MAEHLPLALEERYMARSGFFRRRVRDAQFEDWQRQALSATWRNLVWDWEALDITPAARAAADRLGFVPSEVFAHPEILAISPELEDYYRLLACLPNKGLAQINSSVEKGDRAALCKLSGVQSFGDSE
jgi:hypothetical protein